LTRELQYARTDVERERICDLPPLLDQRHGCVRIISLCDQDGRAHCHAAVTPTGAMRQNLAAVVDRLQGGMCSALQSLDRDREQRVIKRGQPQRPDRVRMQINARTIFKAHVDDQPHAEVAQAVIIIYRGCCADEQVIGDGGEVHAGNGITNFSARSPQLSSALLRNAMQGGVETFTGIKRQ
jgi:hypothetical protein